MGCSEALFCLQEKQAPVLPVQWGLCSCQVCFKFPTASSSLWQCFWLFANGGTGTQDQGDYISAVAPEVESATMASALLGEESHWAHLLQPIKDMAANWDINIAHELEEYLVRRWRIRAPCSPSA